MYGDLPRLGVVDSALVMSLWACQGRRGASVAILTTFPSKLDLFTCDIITAFFMKFCTNYILSSTKYVIRVKIIFLTFSWYWKFFVVRISWEEVRGKDSSNVSSSQGSGSSQDKSISSSGSNSQGSNGSSSQGWGSRSSQNNSSSFGDTVRST